LLITSIQFNIYGLEIRDSSIKWLSWEEAMKLNANKPRDIFIDVYTSWCGWCKKMDASTFLDSSVVSYINKNYYAVKFNAEQLDTIMYDGQKFVFKLNERRGVHEFAEALLDGRLKYPSYVYFKTDMERVMISQGFKTQEMLLKELHYCSEELYKSIRWEDYEKL